MSNQSENGLPVSPGLERDPGGDEPWLAFSIVIPCFNQGRFLTDCLESLAYQTVLPFEVIVVDDGSTDAETNALCARLEHYHYPFRLRSCHKLNGGPSSARNHGVRASSGNVILPLDGDDKLFPDALETYSGFLAAHPEIDICYPDVQFFGNLSNLWAPPEFNRWALLHGGCMMVCTSAIRRRVFEAGFWYDEQMRQGYEDWEFYTRACALGPFRAAPLRRAVFGYRRWGHSISTVADGNRQERFAQVRAIHARQGIWSTAVERRLRTSDAPTHRLVVGDRGWVGGAGDDLAPLPERELDAFLSADRISRFLWLGSASAEGVANLQLIVNETAGPTRAAAYVLVDADRSEPYLVVLDRLAALQGHRADLASSQPFDRVVGLATRGGRFPRLVAVTDHGDHAFGPFLARALAPLRAAPSPAIARRAGQ